MIKEGTFVYLFIPATEPVTREIYLIEGRNENIAIVIKRDAGSSRKSDYLVKFQDGWDVSIDEKYLNEILCPRCNHHIIDVPTRQHNGDFLINCPQCGNTSLWIETKRKKVKDEVN